MSEKKKPSNTAFKQQKLKAWQPILTPKTVIPTFLLIGTIFIPIGIGLFIASDQVLFSLYVTGLTIQGALIFLSILTLLDCFSKASSIFAPPTTPSIGSPITEWKFEPLLNKTCTIRFRVDEQFEPPVFIYYRLTNFYQNHRRYVKSYDAAQLRGDKVASSGALVGGCVSLSGPNVGKPASEHLTYSDGFKTNPDAQFYPCGLIANSLFSDEISNLTFIPTGAETAKSFVFEQQDIAWPSDKEKFKQTKWASEPADVIRASLVPPTAWRESWPAKYANGYTPENLPNLEKFERLQVWMRTSGLPTFRKLWGRNSKDALGSGVWEIAIQDTFNVTRYGGTKSIVISTVSILGGKNPFLGIAYLVIGSLCVFLAILFLARHLIKPRKLGDHAHLSWNKDTANNGMKIEGIANTNKY